MNITILVIGILLVLAVLIGMVVALNASNKAAQKKRMMNVIKGEKQFETNEKTARNDQNKRREELSKKLKESEEDDKEKKKKSMAARIQQAGLSISVKKFWLFSLGSCAAWVGGALLLGLSPLVMVLIGIFGFLGFPRLVLRRLIKRRQKKFMDDFADTLEAMVRLLKAGMPVTEAISMASREFSGPIGEEMSLIYEAQKVGIPLAEASYNAADRMPLTEMYMFATGISIQAQTGASLSEVLMNLAGLIRARYRLRRKVQALSAEAKASAMIIGALPFVVGGGMYLINPDYLNIMFETLPGQIMLAGGGFWMLIGIFIMKIMINFKI